MSLNLNSIAYLTVQTLNVYQMIQFYSECMRTHCLANPHLQVECVQEPYLTLSSLSPHICELTQMIYYLDYDFTFEFLMERRFQRIPTYHIYHKRLVNSFPGRALGMPRKAVD